MARRGPNNHAPKRGHTPVPSAHQTNHYTDVANDIIPDDSLKRPVMLSRIEDLTTVDMFATVAAFTRGLLDYWNTHGHIPLAPTD
jgi:hypothetical protein